MASRIQKRKWMCMSYLPWGVGCLRKKCYEIAVLSSTCKQQERFLRIVDAFLFMQWLTTQWWKKSRRMNHEDGTDPWLSQRPETPPWDAAEYNQLISSGPLLPLLEHYAGIGTMHDKQRRNSCHVRDDEDVILLMSYNLFFSRFLWPNHNQGGSMASFVTGR